MDRQQASEVGRNLAVHRGEWLVLDNGRLVAHAPTLKDCMRIYKKAAQVREGTSPAIYYSPTEESGEMICTTF